MVAERRQPILANDDVRLALREAITQVRQVLPFRIDGWVLLPDHTPRRSAKQCGTLWQHRFWEHLIRDERDFCQHMDYLHANPLRHGLVTRVTDWPWSSFHRCVRQGIYPADWVDGASRDAIHDAE